MNASRRRPALASDDWMLEQQVRAEMEAEAWRRLREGLSGARLATPALAAPVAGPPRQAPNFHRMGSAVFKGLARFALAACAAYLAYLAAWDAQLGAFEAWLAMGGAFVATLALSLLGPARVLIHALSETLRWAMVGGLACGAVWVLMRLSG